MVRATVERLRERGLEFDYEEIQGVTNEVLREQVRRAAFVVDQVWGDTPMDGLAADAALLGKPTVVSGYAWEEHRRLLPPEAFPPSELCDPDGLEAAIGRLLTDERYRLELGARAHAFVTERWEAAAVARRLLDLLEGRAPEEWLCEPASLRYLLGWGQPAERSVELVRAVVEQGGTEALGLSDKPEVEAALLQLASAGAAHVAEPPRRTRPLPRAGHDGEGTERRLLILGTHNFAPRCTTWPRTSPAWRSRASSRTSTGAVRRADRGASGALDRRRGPLRRDARRGLRARDDRPPPARRRGGRAGAPLHDDRPPHVASLHPQHDRGGEHRRRGRDLGAGTTIGRHVILNRGALVGHDVTVGDYVTLGPGANVAGLSTIGDRAYVAMSAVVLDRIAIGADAVVAAGAVVTRDVPPGAEVRGVPARIVAHS